MYLDLPSNLSGPAAKPRVTVARCKPCANPYEADDTPRHLPVDLTQYVLHAFATKSPPYHVTTDDVSAPPILIDVAKITGHQCVRGRGGAIAVLYETHWNGILRPTWERELDLQAFRYLILVYWANGPDHHQPNTRQYQQLRINAAAREIARAKGERHLPGSYRLVTNDVYRARFLSAPLPIGASIWYHSFDGSWWLGKIKQPSDAPGCYVVPILDNSGPALIDLPESAYNTALHAPCGSWCSKPTVALNPSKTSYTANLSLFALSPPSLLRPLRLIMSTSRTPMSTPKFVLSCLTSPCHSSSHLRTQVPLYSSPFSIASSGPLCLRPRFYCATKALMSTLKTSAFKTETLISTPKATISTPESIMPTSLDLQPRGFREI